MAKSMKDFKVRGGPDKKAAKITKVLDFRHASESYRQSFERYWKRDVEDIEGHVDNGDSKKFPYRSRLRPPWTLYMINAWVDSQTPIILDEDHPIELGRGRSDVPEASVKARQALLDYYLYKTGFQWKHINFTRSEVSHGTALWQVVRHAGKAKRDVVTPVVDPNTGNIVNSKMKEQEVYVPYYGPGIEEVSLWDFYPDPGGKYMDTMPRCVRRHVMTKEEIQRRWPETKKIPDKTSKTEGLSWERLTKEEPGDDYRKEYDKYTKLSHSIPMEQGGSRYTVYVMWDTEADEIIVTLGDSYLLDYQSLEMGDKKLPFVKSTYLPWGGTGGDYFYGKSLPTVIHALAKAAECLLNMGIDAMKWEAQPALIVSRMAQANLTEIRRGDPGAIIEVMGNPSLVQQLYKQSPLSNTMNEIGFIFQMMQMASNVSNYSTGNNAEGFNRTATGVVTLTQRAQSGFLQHAKVQSSVALEPLGEKFDQSACVMLDKPEVINIVGKDGESFMDEFTYEDLTADITVRPKRLRDHSEKAMNANMWQQFIQSGGLQLPGINPQEVMERFFTALGEPNIEKLLPKMTTMLLQMRQPVDPAKSLQEVLVEHQQLQAEGFMKPPVPDEDDMAHLGLHRTFENGGLYQGLPRNAQVAFQSHLIAHEQFHAQEQQVNEMLAAQQQLPAGSPPPGQPGQIGPDVLAQGQQGQAQGTPTAPTQPGLTPESVGGTTANSVRGGAI